MLEAIFDWQEFWRPFNFMLHGAQICRCSCCPKWDANENANLLISCFSCTCRAEIASGDREGANDNRRAKGIAIVDNTPVNHSWRLIRREDLRLYQVKGRDFPWEIHTAP